MAGDPDDLSEEFDEEDAALLDEIDRDSEFWGDLQGKLEENNLALWQEVWLGGTLAAYHAGEKKAAQQLERQHNFLRLRGRRPAEPPREWSLEPNRSRKYFDERGLQFVKDLTDTDLTQLKSLIRENWNAGEEQFVRNIEDSPIADEARLKNIYRTETHVAHSAGAYQFAHESGAQFKQWLTAIDERTCELCADMDGQVRPIDQPYDNGQMYAEGHPGCRCTDLYFIESKYQDEELTEEEAAAAAEEEEA